MTSGMQWRVEISGLGSSAANMQVLPNSTITTLLQSDDAALGSISEILIPKSTKYDRDVNVRLPSDKQACDITDICLTLSSEVYFIDSNNCRIKKLDVSCTITEHFDLPGTPWGLCEVDNKRLAVTLYNEKKVQILSQNPMSLGKSFSVGDRCRGIDCHNGQLYVCCGGLRDKREGPGRVEVYNMGGNLLTVYYRGAVWPLYVNVSHRGDLLISNSVIHSLTILRMHEHTPSYMQIKGLRGPRKMSMLSDNLLCVAGHVSNNIVLISADGEHQQELLTESDGITKPMAVCFDRHRSRLIVSSFASDIITIFQINT